MPYLGKVKSMMCSVNCCTQFSNVVIIIGKKADTVTDLEEHLNTSIEEVILMWSCAVDNTSELYNESASHRQVQRRVAIVIRAIEIASLLDQQFQT